MPSIKIPDESGNWITIPAIAIPAADTLPIGFEGKWPGLNAPAGWLIEDGQAVSRTEYHELFDLIGTTFGAGDGSATFNVPDMRGVVAVGLDLSQTEFNEIGKLSGSKTHTLTQAELPEYRLPVMTAGPDHPASTIYPGGSASHGFGFTPDLASGADGYGVNWYAESGGSDVPHNNIQPSRAFNWVIKAKQVGVIQSKVIDNLNSVSTSDALSANMGRLLNENKLDVEEGTWTVTVFGTTTAGTPTYAGRSGTYQKIGSFVRAQFYANITALGGMAGYIRISLPFVASTATGYNEQWVFGSGVTKTGLSALAVQFATSGESYASLHGVIASGGSLVVNSISHGDLSTPLLLYGTITLRAGD